jgi:hypothetical protein
MADQVTMTALDTMHISNVQNENISEGDVFIVTESDAKELEKRGLAERGGSASKALNADRGSSSRPETREELDAERGLKAEKASPANKMLGEPANKTISASSVKSPAQRKGA